MFLLYIVVGGAMGDDGVDDIGDEIGTSEADTDDLYRLQQLLL